MVSQISLLLFDFNKSWIDEMLSELIQTGKLINQIQINDHTCKESRWIDYMQDYWNWCHSQYSNQSYTYRITQFMGVFDWCQFPFQYIHFLQETPL